MNILAIISPWNNDGSIRCREGVSFSEICYERKWNCLHVFDNIDMFMDIPFNTLHPMTLLYLLHSCDYHIYFITNIHTSSI